MFEPGEAQREVVGDVFEDGGQTVSSLPADQALQGGSDQGQGTSGIGAAQSALIFAPANVSLPMATFTGPVQPDASSHALRLRFCQAEAADKMPCRFLGLSRFFVRRSVAHLDQLASFWKIRRLRIGGDGAQLPDFGASVSGVGLAKRGRAGDNCLWAC